MTKTPNQRLIALKNAGGTRRLRALPLRQRAQAIASLMLEGPAKPRSSKAAALAAFKGEVEKGEVFRARKLACKFSLPEEDCSRIVLSKVKALRAARDEQKSRVANDFEIVFGLSSDAKGRFAAAMEEALKDAKQKLRTEHELAHIRLERLIEMQQDRGIDVNISDAAAWLSVSFIRRRRLGDAFGTIRDYFLENGRLGGPQRILVEDELKKILPACSEGYLIEVKETADKLGLGQLLHDSALRMASSLDFTNLTSVEKAFQVSRAFGIKSTTECLGNFLANSYMGRAEAQPDKFMEDYVDAARAALFAGLDGLMEEALGKYLALHASVCPEDPKGAEKAMYVFLEFGKPEQVREFGSKAAFLYLSEGNLEKAEEMANESGNRELLGQVCTIKELASL